MLERNYVASDETLNDAIEFVEDELNKIDCPLKTIMQVNVCVEEMFVNVAHYAYNGAEGNVNLSVDTQNKTIKIVLTDEGVPFDPLKKDDPDISLSAEERNIGGLGIFMVKKTMDEVSYERRDGKNIFTMIKKF